MLEANAFHKKCIDNIFFEKTHLCQIWHFFCWFLLSSCYYTYQSCSLTHLRFAAVRCVVHCSWLCGWRQRCHRFCNGEYDCLEFSYPLSSFVHRLADLFLFGVFSFYFFFNCFWVNFDRSVRLDTCTWKKLRIISATLSLGTVFTQRIQTYIERHSLNFLFHSRKHAKLLMK